MSIFEYDEEREIRLIRQSEHELGFEQGMERGLEQGLEQHSISVAKIMLAKKEPLEKIEEYSGLSKKAILELMETTEQTL